MKFNALLPLLLTCFGLCQMPAAIAQDLNPGGLELPGIFGDQAGVDDTDVAITATLTKLTDSSASLAVTMTLPPGAYTYSMDPSFGAATRIKLTSTGGLQQSGTWQADRAPKSSFEQDLHTEKFYDRVTWTLTLNGQLSATTAVSGTLNGQFCNSRGCFPLFDREFSATLSQSSTPASTTTDSAPATSASAADQNPSRQTLTPPIGFGKTAKAGDVKFEISLTPANAAVGSEVTLSILTTVAEGWHIFALDQNPEMAGIPTTIDLRDLQGLELTGAEFTADTAAQVEQPLPDITQRVHYGMVTWSRRLKVTAATGSVGGSIRFQICRDGICKPPTKTEFRVALSQSVDSTPAGVEVRGSGPPTDGASSGVPAAATGPKAGAAGQEGLFEFLLTAIGAGFVALATPCVFPMIPVTVAFFLKQEEKRAGSSMKLALVYCLSIIAAFTVLGIAMSKIFGGTSLTNLANNAWLNLFFTAVFAGFALMLLGVFELSVPYWVLNWTSSRESAGGFVGVVFMALTFTLVSFTCTFAFVGPLLVLSASGDLFWPVLGMLGFSTAFASPFFILAMFPGMLKKLPRSGGWMNDVKFVIGLVEVAAALKFLSVADIGLSKERMPTYVTFSTFLWVWVALAAYAGLYLLGLKFGSRPRLSISRSIFAGLFLLLAGRMAAGAVSLDLPEDIVWQQVSAFAPPDIVKGQHPDFGYVVFYHDQPWALQHENALAQASRIKRPVLLDVTGVNCVNCRSMERNVLARREVRSAMADLVLNQVYLDMVPGIADEKLQEQILEFNRNLAVNLLNDVAMPSYALVSPDGRVLSTYTEIKLNDPAAFLAFLKQGLDAWNNGQPAAAAAVAESTAP